MYWHSISSRLIQGGDQQYALLSAASVKHFSFCVFFLFFIFSRITCMLSLGCALVFSLDCQTSRSSESSSFISGYSFDLWELFPDSVLRNITHIQIDIVMLKRSFPLCPNNQCYVRIIAWHWQHLIWERDQPQYLRCCLAISLHVFESFSDFHEQINVRIQECNFWDYSPVLYYIPANNLVKFLTETDNQFSK